MSCIPTSPRWRGFVIRAITNRAIINNRVIIKMAQVADLRQRKGFTQ
jgi:hypothetical protein